MFSIVASVKASPIVRVSMTASSAHHTARGSTRPAAPPLHQPLQAVELRQAEAVVQLGGVAVALLGALPELAVVGAAGEHGPVLLRLVLEDRLLLPLHVVRA